MKKILKKYCFKYLLVFLLILGACVPVAVVSYRVMKEQVMETSQLHLEEGTNQLNRFLEQMTAIVRSSEQDADSYVNLSRAKDAFRDLGAVYTLSPYFFTLFQNNDIFLSSDQCSGRFSQDYYGKLLTIWENGEVCREEQLRAMLFERTGAQSFFRTFRRFETSG